MNSDKRETINAVLNAVQGYVDSKWDRDARASLTALLNMSLSEVKEGERVEISCAQYAALAADHADALAIEREKRQVKKVDVDNFIELVQGLVMQVVGTTLSSKGKPS